VTGHGVGGATPRRTLPVLYLGPGFCASAFRHGKIGGADHPFKLFGIAVGTLHFHRVVFPYDQKFKYLITFQATKLI
jgi:hypothetical protein